MGQTAYFVLCTEVQSKLIKNLMILVMIHRYMLQFNDWSSSMSLTSQCIDIIFYLFVITNLKNISDRAAETKDQRANDIFLVTFSLELGTGVARLKYSSVQGVLVDYKLGKFIHDYFAFSMPTVQHDHNTKPYNIMVPNDRPTNMSKPGQISRSMHLQDVRRGK